MGVYVCVCVCVCVCMCVRVSMGVYICVYVWVCVLLNKAPYETYKAGARADKSLTSSETSAEDSKLGLG